MDGAFGPLGRPQGVHQQVWVESGFGYGVIGADLHVFGDGRPVYLLKEASGQADLRLATDGQGLPAQPSHLLNARHAVVDFTGRGGEIDDLTAWRDSGGRAVRWLHALGGQGKTRLAGHLAGLAARDGWKVIVAEHTPARVVDAKEPTNHDLRVGSARGLLMLVDYADRWPLTHLTWLFSNKVLNQNVPVRVLLVARNEHVWPALRHALTQAGWPPEASTSQSLGALPSARDARSSMFVAARDCFARHYGLPETVTIGVPEWLDREEFGLTLTVHMAALVAVDRHARGTPQPQASGEDMMALTAYLLERESLHWHTLHGTDDALAGGRTAFNTPPVQMRRTVFTAALTGPLGYRDARAALEAVGIGGEVDRALTDHTFCYPPTDPRTVLEPLYPDRLAEDFLALCLPGHDLPDHRPDAWADSAPEVLLTPPAGEGALPPYAARAITFLAAALAVTTVFGPHLGAADESLALARECADICRRLTRKDPGKYASAMPMTLVNLASNLAASEPEQAAALAGEAVDGARLLARDNPAEQEYEEVLHFTLASQTATLLRLGRAEPAFAALDEAVRTLRNQRERPHDSDALSETVNLTLGLVWVQGSEDDTAVGMEGLLQALLREARANPAATGPTLLNAFFVTDELLRRLERWELVLAGQRDVIGWLRSSDDDTLRYDYLTGILAARGSILVMLGRCDEALDVVGELAEELQRDHTSSRLLEACLGATLALVANDGARLAQDERPDDAYGVAQDKTVDMLSRIAAAYRQRPCGDAHKRDQGLAVTLKLLSEALWNLGRSRESLAAGAEAVEIRRRLALGKSAEHHDHLGLALKYHAEKLERFGRYTEAAAEAEEAGYIYGRLARDDFAKHGPAFAATRHLLAVNLRRLRPADALQPARQAVEILGRLARDQPARHEPNLAIVLDTLAQVLHERGRDEEARAAMNQAAEVRARLAARDNTPP
ncbi:tetratricopeptide repeat protein [Streptomyces sp. NPDC096191]|uniref:tetratricopeptide repeat protein n=1 Tax=Streptomyces sp. NPDC096191 TaxID=3155426 RepID=UPI0033317313